MKYLLLAGTLLSSGFGCAAFAEDTEKRLEPLTVVGAAGGEEGVAGSISYLSTEDLAALGQSDILRVLRAIPGVNIQEEEGYGLRPNIGLRGSGSDRSSRVMLLEDGVPISPAVYSAPSAYYFPNFTRMSAVEITKGPGVVQYGPRTTGGAVHLISTPIPEVSAGQVELLFGDYGRQRLHANYGSRFELSDTLSAGLLIETVQDSADGFLVRDNGGDTGFDVSDILVKGGLYGDGVMPWSLEFKYQTKEETSEQTYLGLTSFDFSSDPYRLYASTANDVMKNDNELFQLTGEVDLSPQTNLTVIAYQNDVARNWYKLQGISDTGGGASDDRGISTILLNPYDSMGGLSDDYLLMTGAISLDDSIVIRANNRVYQSRGVQGIVTHEADWLGVSHTLTSGLRYHEDFEDRFQHEDAYRLQGEDLFLTTAGAPGSNTNRLTSAEAVSFYALDHIDVTEKLRISTGLRYESYEISRADFSTSDPLRAAGPSRVRSASSDIVLPSLAFLYDVSETLTVLAGVHKGFSPVGATDSNAKDEIAWNYEIGGRYQKGDAFVELIGFFNAYDNLLGECTNSTGSFCTAGDAFNGGEFEARGLELTAKWDAGSAFGASGLQLPVGLSYSFTETEFKSSFDNAFFGVVQAGDELNYLPEHQLTLTAGVIGEKWGVNASLNAVSEARGTIGSGVIPADDSIDARTLLDVSAYYEVRSGLRLKVQAENLFDETYIAARRPAGLRPGKPQEILFGVELSF